MMERPLSSADILSLTRCEGRASAVASIHPKVRSDDSIAQGDIKGLQGKSLCFGEKGRKASNTLIAEVKRVESSNDLRRFRLSPIRSHDASSGLDLIPRTTVVYVAAATANRSRLDRIKKGLSQHHL